VHWLTKMSLVINSFPDMTPYKLVDSRENLIETFFFFAQYE